MNARTRRRRRHAALFLARRRSSAGRAGAARTAAPASGGGLTARALRDRSRQSRWAAASLLRLRELRVDLLVEVLQAAGEILHVACLPLDDEALDQVLVA